MRTFNHSRDYVIVAHKAGPDGFNKLPLGTTFNIVGVKDCSGKRARDKCRCEHGGPSDCPGYVLLDKPPFNQDYECYSWGGKSIFDFFMDQK